MVTLRVVLPPSGDMKCSGQLLSVRVQLGSFVIQQSVLHHLQVAVQMSSQRCSAAASGHRGYQHAQERRCTTATDHKLMIHECECWHIQHGIASAFWLPT